MTYTPKVCSGRTGNCRNVSIASVIASVLAVAQAQAQAAAPPSSPVLEEIIVTAERRAESQLDTPISIAVFNNEALAEKGIKAIADLQGETPNLTINQNGTANTVNIRGIGNSVINPNIATGIAVVKDGMTQAETQGLAAGFFDVGTIEILRGPQGTFVGQSSTGGAIRINSAEPDLNGVSGNVSAAVGSYSNQKLTGGVTVPLSDTWAARFAFNGEKRNSYYDNRGSRLGVFPAGEASDPGRLQETELRATFLWQPSDNFRGLFKIESNSVDHDGPAQQPNLRTFINGCGQAALANGLTLAASGCAGSGGPGISHSRYYAYDDAGHDPWVLNYNNLATQDRQTSERYIVDLRYTFGNGLELRSLTGFQHNNIFNVDDGDRSSANAVFNAVNIGPNNNYYQQEFLLVSPAGPLNWITGVNWFYRDTSVYPFNIADQCGENPGTGLSTTCPDDRTGAYPTQGYAFVKNLAVEKVGGVFGQVNWSFTDELELQLGLRYNIDRGGTDNETVAVNNGAFPTTGPLAPLAFTCPSHVREVVPSQFTQIFCINPSPSFKGEYKDETPTWKVGLNWSPGGEGGDSLIYAFYARGYKRGGATAAGVFDPETVDDFELGWKGKLFDDRVQLSVGGFWMEYEGMQQNLYRPTTTNGTQAAAANVGDATIKGLELDLRAQFGGLGASLGAGYTNSKLKDATHINASWLPMAAQDPIGPAIGPNQCTDRSLVTTTYVGGVATVTPGPGGCFNYYQAGAPWLVNVTGNPNIYSPELSYTVAFDYAIPVGGSTLRPRVSFSHTDEQYASLLQQDFYNTIDKRDLLNASLTYEAETWLVQLFSNNLTDKTYVAGVSDADSVTYGAPRTIGLRFDKRF